MSHVYGIEPVGVACDRCGHGERVTIVGPGLLDGEVTWDDRADAAQTVDLLEIAYAQGRIATERRFREQPEETSLATANALLLRGRLIALVAAVRALIVHSTYPTPTLVALKNVLDQSETLAEELA